MPLKSPTSAVLPNFEVSRFALGIGLKVMACDIGAKDVNKIPTRINGGRSKAGDLSHDETFIARRWSAGSAAIQLSGRGFGSLADQSFTSVDRHRDATLFHQK